MNEDKDTVSASEIFGFFNEMGIITQLVTAMFAKSLPDGVHPSHFSILNHLARLGDDQPPARIASAMQVSKNTMTHSLKVLEGRGYIDVRPDPEDGRGKRVFLTDAGWTFRNEAISRVSELFGDIIGPEQIEIMHRIGTDLKHMLQHLDENR